MIIVTGGAGFIGSAFVARLNEEGIDDILIVDNLGDSDKWKNLVNLRYRDYLHKHAFLDMLLDGAFDGMVAAVVHMGACSSTTERDADYLMENNYRYTQHVAEWCLAQGVRLIYASSAATYGNGEHGFSDDPDTTMKLRPVNMYGYSKQLFDLWALRTGAVSSIAGLKFFNVFGPNEYHKGEMRSMVCKAFEQIRDTGRVKLFRSYRPEYPDGGQQRDFIYVKDVADTMFWLLQHPEANGIFNLGTGRASTWLELVNAVFAAMERTPSVEFVEMPEAIRGQYQYHTCAQMARLREAGYSRPFTEPGAAVADYVRGYLLASDPWLGAGA